VKEYAAEEDRKEAKKNFFLLLRILIILMSTMHTNYIDVYYAYLLPSRLLRTFIMSAISLNQ
jgi:hypothetical protein